MNRDDALGKLVGHAGVWDIAIIGGGATGVGIAVDAASRGYSVCLLEQSDFGKGTSSRSTKLIHGGVRYLQQGNVPLVMEALKERGILRNNARHLVHDLSFVVPNYAWWEAPFYGIGMKVYDALAFRYGFGKSRLLSKQEVIERIPTLEQNGLRGGVLYFDGQFDDARLLINLCQTAGEQGAVLVNYCAVTGLHHDADGFVQGVGFKDVESGEAHSLQAKCVINATGPFSDGVRKLDDPGAGRMIAPSQGVHVVLDRSFLPGESAIMVPRTSDGRVMFAIPWHNHALIGTTDTPVKEASLDPVAQDQEIEFILETASQYLARHPTRGDILSVFAGIRPLVKQTEAGSTAAISREHTILVSKSGLLTIAGGKWTTYRKMAEDCVDQAATLAELDERACVTRDLKIHGNQEDAQQFGELRYYGSDAAELLRMIESDPDLGGAMHEGIAICPAQVVWACRYEMARTLDDVLSRRTRVLFLNARAAMAIAPAVAAIMARELKRSAVWEKQQVEAFGALAGSYLPG